MITSSSLLKITDWSDTTIGHALAVRSLSFAPDGRTLISGCDDRSIHVYDVEHGQLASVLNGHGNWVLSVAANPDISKQQLASGSADNKIKIWDLGMRAVLDTQEVHDEPVRLRPCSSFARYTY